MASTTRKIGNAQVDAIGWGAMGLSAFYGAPKPDKERFAVLDGLYELGQRNWDSADVYGDSEDLLGKWFKENPEKRKDIFLATKFANKLNEDGTREVNSSAEYSKAAVEKSLKRLGVDYIDLYYCHRLNPNTPIEQTVRALAELKAEGKIRHIGLSECSAESLRRAYKVHPIDAIQMEYSPFSLDIEKPEIGVLAAARELGVAIVAYSPIGRGLISGQLRSPADFEEGDFRKNLPRFTGENFKKNLELVDLFAGLAKKKGCTQTQLCIAWLLAQGEDIIPIPGSTNMGRIKENWDSTKIKLTKEEEAEIRKACDACETQGARYAPGFIEYCFVDTVEE